MPGRTLTRLSFVAPFFLLVAACGDSETVDPLTVPSSTTPPPEATPASSDVPSAAPSTPATASALRFIGRFDRRDLSGPKSAWAGSRVVATFDGTSATARLLEQPSWDGPSEWTVRVDGMAVKRLSLKEGLADYELAKGFTPGAHTVELIRETDATSGVTQVLGFDFAGGTLLAPKPGALHRIEIVGDSDASGYGMVDDGQSRNCRGVGYKGRYQSFTSGWAFKVAEKLGADLVASVASGKGVSRNEWREDAATFGVIYPRALPSDATSTFDLTALAPEAVVLAVGSADFAVGQPRNHGAPDLALFETKLTELTGMVRSAHPFAQIVLVTSGTLSDGYPRGRDARTNVSAVFRREATRRVMAGDLKVSVVEVPEADSAELTACDSHGALAYHDRVASTLAMSLKVNLGW